MEPLKIRLSTSVCEEISPKRAKAGLTCRLWDRKPHGFPQRGRMRKITLFSRLSGDFDACHSRLTGHREAEAEAAKKTD